MAFAHGSRAKFFLHDRDLSTYLKSAGVSREADTAETSTLGDTDKKFVAGLKSGSFPLEGFLDPAVGAVEALLRAQLGNQIVALYLPQGDALGNFGHAALATLKSDEVGTDIGDAGTVAAELEATDEVDRISDLHPLGAENATGNGTGVDNGASTANGGAGFLIVTANDRNGTTVVKVQHSSDGSTWVDLVTFTTVNAATVPVGERIQVAGTVNRHLRVTRTIGGSTGSITFLAAFGRR
jgi:hypothetical protein